MKRKQMEKQEISRKMQKKGRAAVQLAAGLLLTAVVSGCGASSNYAAADTAASIPQDAKYSMDGGIYEEAAAEEMAVETAANGVEAVTEEGAASGNEAALAKRKLIKNVDMSVETEEFDRLLANVEAKVVQLGGYIENSSVYNGSYTSNYRSRNASITARIPSENLDFFVDDVAEQSNVTNKNESVSDVTLQYVDLESHKKALKAEQESLLTMLEHAESIEDIIKINEQLTQVRYQIESMESQLRTYDNKINYSTVYLSVEEVEQYEPYTAQKTAGERISEGFLKNMRRVGNGLQEFGIQFVIALPIILTVAVIIGIVILLVMLVNRAGEKQMQKRRAKKAEQKEKQKPEKQEAPKTEKQENDDAGKTDDSSKPGSSARYRS